MMELVPRERITRLGRLGEDLVAELLRDQGFVKIKNLNDARVNHPFGDLLASKNGVVYFIGVKARNAMRQGNIGLNASYNLVLIRGSANAQLKRQGKTTDEITSLLLKEVSDRAAVLGATPAWATVSIQARLGAYSSYFGLVAQLGNRRSIPMTTKACASYLCLARNRPDRRVTIGLLNA
jgi:Holliday junction resolvase-like predicted endonuclease